MCLPISVSCVLVVCKCVMYCTTATGCQPNCSKINKYIYIYTHQNFMLLKYRVFTNEWRGFKNLLNDYILQLDGAPPFSQECTRATQSCSPTALDRTCWKWRQPHTLTIWDEFDYRVDVCRVTQGAHTEGLWFMHLKNLDSCRCWQCRFCTCKVRNKFLVNFWNRTILL
jgi:hypothetical protein